MSCPYNKQIQINLFFNHKIKKNGSHTPVYHPPSAVRRIMKTWILLLIFAVLAFFTYRYLNQEDTALRSDDFAIENTNQIGKIVMWDKTKKRVTLTRKKDGWQVNGKYPVRKEAIDILLQTFENLDIVAQVPKAAEENVIRSININSTITEIYNKDGKLMKELYVGDGARASTTTYMMQKGSKYPYEISLPNWQGVLKPRFMLNEIDWRDRAVFRIPSDKIKTVQVEYFAPEKKELSFKLIRNGNAVDIQKLYGLPAKGLPINKKGMYYIKGFESLVAEAFENDNPKRKSLVNAEPFCEIEVMTTTGDLRNVKLYPVPGRKIGQNEKGAPVRAAVDRYFASVDDNTDFMLVQDRVFKRVLAPVNFFYEEE